MWLQNQESFSLHKPVHREFKRLRVIVGGLHDQYDANLANMQKPKEKNDEVRFLLIVIDVFSHHLWMEPLLNKTEEVSQKLSGVSFKGLQSHDGYKQTVEANSKGKRWRTILAPSMLSTGWLITMR